MPEPGRFIQTTLVDEDKAASFIFVEGLDRSALVEMENGGMIRPRTIIPVVHMPDGVSSPALDAERGQGPRPGCRTDRQSVLRFACWWPRPYR